MKRIPPVVYNLAFGAVEDGFKRVTAAEARTVVPRSFVLAAKTEKKVIRGRSHKSTTRGGLQAEKKGEENKKNKNVPKMTLSPSLHISVTIVSPG
jgi:hypothetical protein